MPSDQREPITEVGSPDSSLSVTPHIISPSPSELSVSHESDSDPTDISWPAPYGRIEIPHEETLRDILLRSTGTNDLSSVTKVRLQVIAVDVSLQHICFHVPLLTELNLDGSIVSSLRDLGCGLRNLKVLRICRCGLTSLDGMSGLQSIEELYAQSNTIQDLSPCSWLPYIRVIDLKRNCIKDLSSVSFLSLCSKLEHLLLDENEEVIEIPGYREIVKSLLPKLKTLDDKDITKEMDFNDFLRAQNERGFDQLTELAVEVASPSTRKDQCLPSSQQNLTPRTSTSKRPSSMESNVTFTVRFPPKALSPRPSSESSTDSTFITYTSKHVPQDPDPEEATSTIPVLYTQNDDFNED